MPMYPYKDGIREIVVHLTNGERTLGSDQGSKWGSKCS